MQPLELVDVALVGLHQQQVDLVQIVAIFGGCIGEALAQLLAFKPGKILLERIGQLALIHPPLLEHQFLQRCQAVAQVGDPHLQAGDPVIDGAPLLDGLAALDAVIHQGAAEDVVGLGLQHAVDHAVDLDGLAGEVAHLIVPAGHHLVEVAERALPQRLGLGQEDLAGGGVTAAIERRQQDAGEVDKAHAGTAIAPLAGHRGFDAADGGVVVGILLAHPELDELGDHHLVVVEGGHAEAAADHLDAGVEEILAHAGVVAHREVGLGGAQLAAGLQNRVGEAVDRVMGLAIAPILAADGDVLIERAAGGGLGVGAGADLVHLQQLEPAPL